MFTIASTETLERRPRSATPGEQARVLVAHVVNGIGDGITTIALPLLIFTTSGSITQTSFVLVISVLPPLLFGMWAGTIADRVNRQYLIVAGDLIRGTALLSVPSVYAHGGVLGIAAIAFFARTVGTFEQPAADAVLPSFAGEGYQRFLGRRSGLLFLAQALGPAVGGALVGVFGASNAILVDAATFLLAGTLAATIKSFDRTWGDRRRQPPKTTREHVGDGLRHLRGNTIAAGFLSYWAASSAAVPIALVAAIPYLLVDLEQGSLQYGLAVACFAAASIAGSQLAGRTSCPGGRRVWLLASGLGYGAVNLVMLAQPPYLAFCALWVIWGLAYGPEEVLSQLTFAEAIPEQLLGRMYSLAGIAFAAAGAVGYAVAGPLTAAIGPATTMAVAGVIFVIATLSSFGVGPLARALRSGATQSGRDQEEGNPSTDAPSTDRHIDEGGRTS